MRAQPDHQAERVNQTLFGEAVRFDSERSGYSFIQQTDGYTGWVDSRFLNRIGKVDFESLRRGHNAIVTTRTARLCSAAGDETAPFFLYYGTQLRVTRSRSGWAEVNLPGIPPIRLRKGTIQPIDLNRSRKTSRSGVAREAKRFLGVPYLWGGISTSGFDCSGLVRTVFSRFGINLPRDTKDQIKEGCEIERDEMKHGDLIFFDRHVGIACGEDSIVHASLGGGGVRVNSIRPSGVDYRQDLDRDYRTTRRII